MPGAALRDMNLPKFVFEDVPLFLGLINDLFPGLACERVRYETLNDAVESALQEDGYKPSEHQANKVIQLYETMLTRHTTMVVGPTGGGKSVVLGALVKAQNKLDSKTTLFVLNPKAQTVVEMYGHMDPSTREWTDGLFSNIFREMNRPLPAGKENEKRYVLFDGDVDALWVENMNSVMDDNKLLTLPNGERIRLQPFCKLLFEVGDLQYASPATVSRCGMVYIDPKDLNWAPYVWKWLRNRPMQQQQDSLKLLVDKYVNPLMNFVIDGLVDGEYQPAPKHVIPRTSLQLAKQLCFLLNHVLGGSNPIVEQKELEGPFVFSLVWSLGGALVADSRKRFDAMLKNISGLPLIESKAVSCGPTQLPGEQPTLYEYLFDPTTLKWISWLDIVPEFVPIPNGKFYQIMVPTVDTVRNSWLTLACLDVLRPPLLVGESGTAKTVNIDRVLSDMDPEKNLKLTINFSSRTSAADIQRIVEDNVEKRLKNTFGPPVGKKLLVFIDDMNMPRVDTYGTQQPIALLKIMMEREGMYDKKDLNWKNLRDLIFLGAMGPPGGARNPVDPRFISLFSTFCIVFPSAESLHKIYNVMGKNHFAPFHDSIAQLAGKLTDATMSLYATIVQQLPPTPSKFHYIFNLRDLSRVFEGLCLATPDKMENSAAVIRLWRNESLRVFHDR